MSLRSFRLVLFAAATVLLTPSVASAAWTVPPTPNPDGAHITSLVAVDCSSAHSCMAVGFAIGPAPGQATTVAEQWDGSSWQIVPTPNPPGATNSSLDGISCPWRNVCLAVGRSGSSTTSVPLVELWNGTSWSIQPSPAVPRGTLTDIDCSGLLSCTAVGYAFIGTSANIGTLAERWDGTGWHVQSTPNANGAGRSSLYGVSCPLRRTCTAVGLSTAGSVDSPLVERWSGRVNAWRLQAAPKPAGAEGADLSGVSCPDARVCMSVGASSAHLGPRSVLAERRIGSTWSILPISDPPQGSFPSTGLSEVSCPARNACHATGTSESGLIAERFDGASWLREPVPVAPSVPFLPGVSCPSRFFCMAVGGWDNNEGVGGTLAARWTP
jgi:hypothetical protein